MEINKINSTNAISSTQNEKRVNAIAQDAVAGKDSVDFSKEGKTQALYTKAMQVIKETPDIRMDKVEEARKLLASFKNPSDAMLEDISKKILRDFGL